MLDKPSQRVGACPHGPTQPDQTLLLQRDQEQQGKSSADASEGEMGAASAAYK